MRPVVLLFAALAACSNPSRRDEPVPSGGSAAGSDAVAVAATPQSPAVVLETATGELRVAVEVADTWPKIERGLMYREHLPPDGGMLFLMGEERDHTFYMRNTLIPLDMIFITKDLRVAGVVQNAEPRTETLRRVGATSLYVLEVNGGWTAKHQVGPGTKVRFVGVPN